MHIFRFWQKSEGNDMITVIRKADKPVSEINRAIQDVATDWFMVIGSRDRLSENALTLFTEKIKHAADLVLAYADEDRLEKDGSTCRPFFKPDWSPDLLLSMNYIGRTAVYRTEEVRKRDLRFREGLGQMVGWDFTIRYLEETGVLDPAEDFGTERAKICHIPEVLLYQKQKGDSLYRAEDIAAGKKMLEEYLERRGYTGTVEVLRKADPEQIRLHQIPVDARTEEGGYRIRYADRTAGRKADAELPLVSIVIPSKDNVQILQQCLESIRLHTDYPSVEIVLVDNGSSEENKNAIEQYLEAAFSDNIPVKYLYQPMPFNFSRMCNIGAEAASGEYILLLNDDMEILQDDWLRILEGQASGQNCGAAGAKLLYPGSRTIQHIGITNLAGGPSHNCIHRCDDEDWYMGRNRLLYNYLAVTGACLLVSAEKYREAGGLDENFAVAYNDVDLCYTLYEKGYYNVVRQDVILYHHESVSRGVDAMDEQKMERLIRERTAMYAKHSMDLGEDPFYNPNLNPSADNFLLPGEQP
ncbi:MAG: glycosyltransferase family 2 protein [Eubacteriales bacterium]|nr:glycosyltransferase family 2 protein [Eubacteriales bacterium]